MKRLLLKLANTKWGRKHLGVPEGKTVIAVTDRYVHYLRGELKDGLPLITSMGSRLGDDLSRKLSVFTLSKRFFLSIAPALTLITLAGLSHLLPDVVNIGLLLAGTTTGAKAPSTTGFDIWGFGAGDANKWTNPTNAYSDDGNYATAGNPGANEYQSFGGYSYGVYSGATINGIEAKVQAKSSSGTITATYGIYEVTTAYRTKQFGATTSETVFTLGSSSDVWGGTWASTDFDDPNGYNYILCPATGATLSVDYLTQEITFTGGTPPSTDYTIEVLTGAFTLTNNNVFFVKALNMLVGSGSFVLTLIDALFVRGYSMCVATGEFVLTGTDVLIRKAMNMISGTGAFVLTLIDVLLNKAFNMCASTGEFILTGNDILIRKAMSLTVGAGTFTLTLIDAAFSRGYRLMAGVGKFVLTGIDVILSTTANTFWTNQTKNTTTYTEETKNSTTWEHQDKS